MPSTRATASCPRMRTLHAAAERCIPGYHPKGSIQIPVPLCLTASPPSQEGIAFIGPLPQTLKDMGDKTIARTRALECGLPIVPGTNEARGDAY